MRKGISHPPLLWLIIIISPPPAASVQISGGEEEEEEEEEEETLAGLLISLPPHKIPAPRCPQERYDVLKDRRKRETFPFPAAHT